jgi:4-hydroxybenzoate polyprenyltransferase
MQQLLGLAQAVRPHQWAKNALVALPLLAAHQLDDVALLLRVLAGFVVFCLVASSIYLVNDYKDIEADRSHPKKQYRPLAAGRLSPRIALTAATIGGVAGITAAIALGFAFAGLVLGYVGLSLGYTLCFKRVVFLDVFVLVALYLLRILAGGALVGVALSPWLLAFSLFIFFSLALVKRHAELLELGQSRDLVERGRGWTAEDIPLVRTLGVAAGLISVLVLALYVDSEQSALLYREPLWLWLACPLLLFWIVRIWRITEQGAMHHDPLVFAMRDAVSVSVGLAIVAVLLLALLGGVI